MPAIAPGLLRGKVAVEVRKNGPRYMRLPILLLADVGLGEIVTAVEHAPLRMIGQRFSGDESGLHACRLTHGPGARSDWRGGAAHPPACAPHAGGRAGCGRVRTSRGEAELQARTPAARRLVQGARRVRQPA